MEIEAEVCQLLHRFFELSIQLIPCGDLDIVGAELSKRGFVAHFDRGLKAVWVCRAD